MNALTKLTVAALSAAGIAGGVAVAQTTQAPNTIDGRADTANYGTPPGAPLKRDGSLSADPIVTTTVAPVATTTTTATTDTTVVTPVADTSSTVVAPAADTSAAPTTDAAPQPRADRN